MAGCTSADDLPVEGGGGGGTPIDRGQAIVISHGAGGTSAINVEGRVCLISDPRDLALCSNTAESGIIVSLGTATTVTLPNGQFVLPAPPGSNLSFVVSGPNITPTTMPLTSTNTIPVLPLSLFQDLMAANGVVLQSGTGSILASVVDRTGAPVAGVSATSVPTSAFGPFFDGTTPTQWTLNQTGQAGVVLFPGVTVGPATLTFSDLGSGTETTVGGVQVVDGGLTIEEAVLP